MQDKIIQENYLRKYDEVHIFGNDSKQIRIILLRNWKQI